MNRLQRGVLLLTGAFGLGCGTTSLLVDLPVEPQPLLWHESPLAHIQPRVSFAPGSVVDERDDSDRLSSIETSLGTVVVNSAPPIDIALFDGISSLIRETGHLWNPAGDPQLLVNLEIIAVRTERPSDEAVTSGLSIRVILSTADGAVPVYAQVYRGADFRTFQWGSWKSEMAKSVRASYQQVLGDMARDELLAVVVATVAKALSDRETEA